MWIAVRRTSCPTSATTTPPRGASPPREPPIIFPPAGRASLPLLPSSFPSPARVAFGRTRGPSLPLPFSLSLSLPPLCLAFGRTAGSPPPPPPPSPALPSLPLSPPPRRAATLQASVRPRHRPRRGIGAPSSGPQVRPKDKEAGASRAPRRHRPPAPCVSVRTLTYPRTFIRGFCPTSFRGPPGDH